MKQTCKREGFGKPLSRVPGTPALRQVLDYVREGRSSGRPAALVIEKIVDEHDGLRPTNGPKAAAG